MPPGIPTNATVATKTFDGSAIDPSGNTITVSLGRATGSGIAFNLFGVALNAWEPVFYHYNGPANTAIPGLVDGAEYWVDVPEDQYDPNGTNALLHATDSETVSLAPSYTASEYGSTVDFGCPATIVTGGPCGGTGYSLVPAHYLSSVGASGLGIGANLNATDNSSASASISDPEAPSKNKVLQVRDKVTEYYSQATSATNSIFDALAWKLATYMKSSQSKTSAPDKQSVAVGGGLAFSYADHTATVTIGPGAQLDSAGVLYLQSNVGESTQLSASSSITGTSYDQKSKTAGSQHKTAISVALSIADMSNNTFVNVGAGAVLNCATQTLIASEVAYPLLTQLANLPGSVGQLVGALRTGALSASSILGLIWNAEKVPSKAKDAASNPIATAAGFFGNGYSNATAEAEKLAVAGSVTVLFFANDAEANIASGAKINQGPFLTAPDPLQIVEMYSENLDQLIGATGQLFPSAKSGSEITPQGKSDRPGAVGGSFTALVLENTTLATVASGVSIGSGTGGGVGVAAEEYALLVGAALAGAAADSTSVSGSVTLFDQTSTTLAQIDSGVTITGGPLSLSSASMESVLGGAGDVTTGHGVGIGISAVLSFITRNTIAVIGPLDLSAPGNSGTNINVTGGVSVSASNDGVFATAAVAGTVVSKQEQKQSKSGSTDPLATAPPKALKLLTGSSTAPGGNMPQAKTGVAIAGAAAVNVVTESTLAYINDRGTIVTDPASGVSGPPLT